MKLEEKILKILTHEFGMIDIPWEGEPNSQRFTPDYYYQLHKMAQSHFSAGDVEYSALLPNDKLREFANKKWDAMWKVDQLISEAPLNVALTSPMKYVRECKKWYLDNVKPRTK